MVTSVALFMLLLMLSGHTGNAQPAPQPVNPFPPVPPPVPPTPGGAPWPQVVPPGLPPFPGPGWVPDEPPPPEVQARAQVLLPGLWQGGEGTFKVEQTAGRWIVYQAATHNGRQSVIAWREASAATQPAVLPSGGGAAVLKNGSSGPAVVQLQQLLVAHGYSNVVPDGKFGPVTLAAVLAFQGSQSPNLKVDGIVGPATWAALQGGSPAPVPIMTSPAPTMTASSPPIVSPATGNVVPAVAPSGHPTVHQGASGPIVQQIQAAVGATPVDGKFGPRTAAKVKAFQAAHGLAADGIVGPQTWNAILSGGVPA